MKDTLSYVQICSCIFIATQTILISYKILWTILKLDCNNIHLVILQVTSQSPDSNCWSKSGDLFSIWLSLYYFPIQILHSMYVMHRLTQTCNQNSPRLFSDECLNFQYSLKGAFVFLLFKFYSRKAQRDFCTCPGAKGMLERSLEFFPQLPSESLSVCLMHWISLQVIKEHFNRAIEVANINGHSHLACMSQWLSIAL